MTQDEIIEMAIQAELNLYVHDLTEKRYIEVIEAFAKLVAAKAIAKLESQEAVAYLCEPDEDGLFGLPTPDRGCKDCFPVYRHPQPTWVGLTVEEIAACCMESTTTQLSFYNAIEAKLKEKNSA